MLEDALWTELLSDEDIRCIERDDADIEVQKVVNDPEFQKLEAELLELVIS